MSKKLCKEGLSINKEGKVVKFLCEKCGDKAVKNKHCCKPVRC